MKEGRGKNALLSGRKGFNLRWRGSMRNYWVVLAVVLFIFISIPLCTIVVKLFSSPGPYWDHLSETRLPLYFYHTILLLLGVGGLTVVIGVVTAWWVSTFEFPGRKIFEWLLILPLSIPTYIMAYAYTGLVDSTGTLTRWSEGIFGVAPSGRWVDLMNLPGAIFILSMSLFPYVYLITRASFARQFSNFYDAAAVLGKSHTTIFFRIGLPLARPAIAAGTALAGMEVLNDYGAVQYLGVPTFTTGIFSAWFSLGDITTAIYLAAILMAFVFLLITAESWQRRHRKYTGEESHHHFHRIQPRRSQKALMTTVCGIIAALSFGLPLVQLLYWAGLTASSVLEIEFLGLVLSSFLLAGGAGIGVALVAIVFLYAVRTARRPFLSTIARWATMGYAIPGAIIAVGLLVPLLAVDRMLIDLSQGSWGLVLTGGFFALMYAYIVRFLAVGYNPIESGFKKVGTQVNEAARTLGANSLQVLWSIDLPLIRASLASSVLFVFVDVLKELPLTLILRPFNFDTLATRAFDLATNEMIAESAIPALVIITTGFVPILLLNHLIGHRNE